MRGLIGLSGREALEEEHEKVRLALIRDGLEQEIKVEVQQAKVQLFASLAHGPSGKILAGNLTDLRFDTAEDYIQALVPYEKIQKTPPQKIKTDEEKREDFLKVYQEWVKQGCPGPTMKRTKK